MSDRVISETENALYIAKLMVRDEGGVNERTVLEAFTKGSDLYVGPALLYAHALFDIGIAPELDLPMDTQCTIGFDAAKQEWNGWTMGFTHRKQFGIGFRAKEDMESTGSKVDLGFPAGFVARTLADCKALAVAFARSADHS